MPKKPKKPKKKKPVTYPLDKATTERLMQPLRSVGKIAFDPRSYKWHREGQPIHMVNCVPGEANTAFVLPEPIKSVNVVMTVVNQRQRILNEFSKSALNIMELALPYPFTEEKFEEIRQDIRLLTYNKELKEQLTAYTRDINIHVSGREWTYQSQWWNPWSEKRVGKHLSVEIVFNPYSMKLSVWPDVENPGKVVRFEG